MRRWILGVGLLGVAAGVRAESLSRMAGDGNIVGLSEYLDAGGDVNADVGGGHTMLHMAAQSGRLDSVRFLIEHGADVNALARCGRTPLTESCLNRDAIEVVRCLLDAGADPDKGKPLLAATERWNLDAVRLLLDRGADPFIRGERGWTFLHYAACCHDPEFVKLALACGIPVNAQDAEGKTALFRLVRWSIGSDVWNVLVDAGADIWKEDREYLTAVDWAEIMRSERIPDDLRKQAASRNIHMAALHGDAEQVARSLDEGVSPNARHKRDGKTPLHWAAMRGHTDVVELLVRRGAKVDARENDGSTPLLKACLGVAQVLYLEQFDLYEFLLDNGADPRAKNRAGQSALSLARYPSLIRALERGGGPKPED